jgi:hypothetical protein
MNFLFYKFQKYNLSFKNINYSNKFQIINQKKIIDRKKID